MFKLTTYSHRDGSEVPAVLIPWDVVRDVLGHEPEGTPEEDRTLVDWLLERAVARTGSYVLRLCAVLLRTVLAHDEAGPLCGKLAEWIEATLRTRATRC